ncbi:MAG: DUF3311 domain-containing protein [Planctomycetota bacterium]
MNAPTSSDRPKGPIIIAVAVVILLVLHQDNWFWEDNTPVFGFMPIGLAYHAGISIAATITWFVATRIAWPVDDLSTPDGVPPGESLDELDGERTLESEAARA